MRFSALNEISRERNYIQQFGGYNHNIRVPENEFYEMQSLSGDNYPTISPRKMRGYWLTRYDFTVAFSSAGVEGVSVSTDGFIERAYGTNLPLKTFTFRYGDARWGEEWKLQNDDGSWQSVNIAAYGISFDLIYSTPAQIDVTILIKELADGLPAAPGHNYQSLLAASGLCILDKYIGSDGRGNLLISDHPVRDIAISVAEDMLPKQMIKMGAYIIILPDKIWVNTANYTPEEDYEWGYIEATYNSTATVKYTPCRIDGTEYTNVTVSATAPSSPTDKQYWLDTSEKPHTLKQYSATQSMWVIIPTVYIKIQAYGIGTDFAQYDGVKLSGLTCSSATENAQLAELNGKYSIIQEIHHDSAAPINDYIVVTGILDGEVTQTNDTPIKVERKMPDMDFVIESNNRLWGCKYGKNANGDMLNEIYASKLGDFKNWNCFMGISSDSYAASVGSFGEFTGAVEYSGYPIFFKENALYKVFGSYPSNFQIQRTDCEGVSKGDARSLCVVDNVLYYKTNGAIVAYDGSLPRSISSAFGALTFNGKDFRIPNPLFDGALAGTVNHKYYINMYSDSEKGWFLYYYDTKLGIWYKEYSVRIADMATYNGILFWIGDGGLTLRTMNGERPYGDDITVPPGSAVPPKRTIVEWSGITGTFGLNLPDKKYISNIIIRLSADVGTDIKVFIQYDSSSEWKQVCHYVGKGLSSVSMPIRPKRCDHFRLRFVGVGDARIYSIAQTIEQGSDY